jgi:HJR/Mrr/RecB family endonuclease
MTTPASPDHVAVADGALRTAEARLAEAQTNEKLRTSAHNQARLVATAWGAAEEARRAVDRWQIARALPVAILPLPLTFFGFVFIAELTGMASLGATMAVVVFTAATAVATFLWLLPSDTVMRQQKALAQTAVGEAARQLEASQQVVQARTKDVAAASARLSAAHEAARKEQEMKAARLRAAQEAARRQQAAEAAFRQTVAYKCEALYRRPWRDLRADGFEAFLAEVFETLGYEVEQTGQSGDQGVDLIVAKHGFRMAIQAKGYSGSVGNTAVQEAFTGMAHYRCDGCAVVTNSQFTPSAISVAESTNCLLVHEGNFREFVFGELVFVESGSGSSATW